MWRDGLALHLSEKEHVPVLHFHLDCPAARNCLSRTVLLFIICRTWCCERSCQSLCSSGYKMIAEIRKALPLLAWPAPRHVAFSGVNVTNLLNQKSTFCLSGCSEMPSSEYGQGGSCSDGAVNKYVVLTCLCNLVRAFTQLLLHSFYKS